MRLSSLPIPFVLLALAVAHGAEEPQGLSLSTAQPLQPDRITATGRVSAVVCARIGARLAGRLVELGADPSGRMLDAGMSAKSGQVLFRLDSTTFANAKAMAEATLDTAKANLANLTAKTREERIEQLREILAELDARITDRKRDQSRFRRLVEQEKSLPARRLEEVDTEVTALQAQRNAASARLREAENGPTASEIAVAQARVREAEAALKLAQDDLRDTTVLAPFDGVVTRRFKSPGDYLPNMPPTDVLELTCLDKLEVELRLPEAYFDAVQENKTPVTLRTPLLKGGLDLKVSRIVNDIDPVKGTFAVRIAIPAEQRGKLVPGAFVTADISLHEENPSVIVPQRCVVTEGGKSFVFIPEGGRMVRREVAEGDRLTDGVVIRSGLARGQKVLVGPAESLKDGSPLPTYLQAGK